MYAIHAAHVEVRPPQSCRQHPTPCPTIRRARFHPSRGEWESHGKELAGKCEVSGLSRRLLAVLASTGLALLLTGCVTVSQYRFSFDSATGEVRREYVDLASRQGADEKGYSVTNDWATLKQMIEEKKPEFDPDVVEDISKSLFAENKTLCARKIQKVKCPKCFPSKAAILSYLHEKDWRFELINDEVVLFLPGSKKIVSTNGQPVTTPKNSLIFWPQDAKKFEYVTSEQWQGGTALLPYYLEEKNAK